MPAWLPGTKVDWLPKGERNLGSVNASGLGGGLITLGKAKDAYDKAREHGQGRRKRAVVDMIVDASTIRLMLCETCEIVWASPDEIEALDAITQLADTITSKSLEQQLAEMDKPEKPE